MPKDLKQLQVLEQKYKNELTVLKEEAKRLKAEIQYKQETVKEIQREITFITQEPLVTEHAIVRYFERIMNHSIRDIKNIIMPKDLIEKIKILGDGEYPVNGFRVVCRKGAVVTILTDGNGN